MSDFTASEKFACPACGGEMQWNAAKQALVCPFCGAESAVQNEEKAAIYERDLGAALQNIPDAQRGWQAEKKTVKCQTCGAITVFDPAKVSQRCDFCGSTALIPYEQTKAPIRPESLLEFRVAEPTVREQVRTWYGSRFWAPNALKSRAMTDTVHGIYLPYWTFDADVHADWTAQAGYHYYVTEYYTDSEGKRQSRQVQKTRWENASGSISTSFDDDLIPASVGVQTDLLRQIEPFPTTTDLKPYNPAYLSGWPVEQYQINLLDAATASRQRMQSRTEALCAEDVPGDTHRYLNVNAQYFNTTFKHILVPIWLLTYTYGSTSYQVVVNGYTGSIAGKYPLSWVKITIAVILGLIVLGIALFFFSQNKH